ncbi:multidrug DMT transporter permease [Arthrobacter sp. PAMC25564]|uniref:multidrug DMT transporter permease n=1 Tax=Arthrobacter sp. PAMC25564 TaxID=2565366 RepID=UPI001F1021F1|nr:multidrug DMT transporter permease [Arthrobacter sp. PAMC25564]
MALEIISLSPMQALGIPIALAGSVCLALGAEFQHRGVTKVNASTSGNAKRGLHLSQLLALTRRPSWVSGTLMLGLAIVLQLISLFLAPLTVVQPLGAVALVVTSIMNAHGGKRPLTGATIKAITFCVGGIGLFVTVAALTTTSLPIDALQLRVVLIILACVLAALALAFVLFRKRFTAIFYIVGAGVVFGFVATLAKVIIDRVHTLIQTGFHLTPDDGLTIVCLVGIVAAALLGSYFVQTAYSSGPPDLVVAGLTVIDPMIGVTIGIVVLGEAASAPLWAIFVFLAAGALAVYGVIQLSGRPAASPTPPYKLASDSATPPRS